MDMPSHHNHGAHSEAAGAVHEMLQKQRMQSNIYIFRWPLALLVLTGTIKLPAGVAHQMAVMP